MLTKFESKSNRVKGLCFHPIRPWVLASLHNGVIQLWDYRMCLLLDHYNEHEGPVRGIDFHIIQPLFASGGDDYKIKVWDYKLRRCLFTLLGHLDYIRTVRFHHEYPWILSCSDDQTIRIWNWQSRTCLAVLTGHNHYVMSASFHPSEDLIVSASLDQTVRVWDFTGLRKKTVHSTETTTSNIPPNNSLRPTSSDLFGTQDVIVKYVLEGHERGVNWAHFHPTLPLVVSGADDRQIKLWRMNETKAWEVDTLRGHTNNVSCAVFHPKYELIISNSEDRSLRIWEISKRMCIQTFRRENDRFWILSVHPTQNLIAAGHDSGMIIFKLERERLAFDIFSNYIFYFKERYLRCYDLATEKDAPLTSIRRTGNLGTGFGNCIRNLSYNPYNPSEHNILLDSDNEGECYELLSFPKTGGTNMPGIGEMTGDARKGYGISSVFVARNRFAVLDKSTRQIYIKNFHNEITKKLVLPFSSNVEFMYFGGTVGRVLLRVEDKIVLYDTQSRRVINEIQAARVKYIKWNSDFSLLALLSKHTIVLTTKQLEHICTINETVRIKSGIWSAQSEIPIFIYTTLYSIKYVLAIPSGSSADHGLLRSLDIPLYLLAVRGDNTLVCLDREGKVRNLSIDMTECEFKISLEKKRYRDVLALIKKTGICGQAIVNYLKEKGYPEIALHFVSELKTRFQLALSCGNLQVAVACAMEMDEQQCWESLSKEALKQGNIQIVEMAYQKTKNFHRLSFLYLVTGNKDKLTKMLKIAEMRNDLMGIYHNALYLGDIKQRIQVLETTGQVYLAFLTAKMYGYQEEEARLKEKVIEMDIDSSKLEVDVGDALVPPVPVYAAPEAVSWPIIDLHEPSLEEEELKARMLEKQQEEYLRSHPVQKVAENTDFYDDDNTVETADIHPKKPKHKLSLVEDGGVGSDWGNESDLDLEDVDHEIINEKFATTDGGKTVSSSPSITALWIANSSVAADHIAAGSFESAMQLLHRQIGVINFEPLKPYFLKLWRGSHGYLPTIGVSPVVGSTDNTLTCFLQRLSHDGRKTFASSPFSLGSLTEILHSSYQAFAAAKFGEMKTCLETIIHSVLLLSVESPSEAEQVKDLVVICREYLIAFYIRQELSTTSTIESNPKRHAELSAYMTHCQLQMAHILLALKSAMSVAYKMNNYITAALFSRRILELPDSLASGDKIEKLRLTAKKVLIKAEKEARNEVDLDYDATHGFKICAKSLTPIHKNSPSVNCPYCNASYKEDYKGQLCNICNLSKIGDVTLGLVVHVTST